jgi:hypothetical protein
MEKILKRRLDMIIDKPFDLYIFIMPNHLNMPVLK